MVIKGVVGLVVGSVAFRAEGRRFESHFSRHVGIFDKSFTRSCMYNDVAPCVAALRLNSTL